MIGYAYSTESNEVVAVIRGSSDAVIERAYLDRYGDDSSYGLTHSPAFGTAGGLIDRDDAVEIDADAQRGNG
jgi:hypothetical protein